MTFAATLVTDVTIAVILVSEQRRLLAEQRLIKIASLTSRGIDISCSTLRSHH
jgi:hypothetical protein